MAIKSSIVKYLSPRTKKPSLLYPTSAIWFNDLDGIEFRWKFNGPEAQDSFTIEVSSVSTFDTGKTWSYTATSSNTTLALSSATGIATHVTDSGVFFWRVKTRGVNRLLMSDWSTSGVLQIDLEAPVMKGVDIIVPVGEKPDGTPAGEIHSSLYLNPIDDGRLGIFVGETDYQTQTVVVSNGSDRTRTFWGTISFDDLSQAEASSGYHPLIEPETTVSSYYWNISSNKKVVSFAIVLSKSQKLRINFLQYGKTTYTFGISDNNLGTLTSIPTTTYRYTSAKLKTLIFIGSSEAPPISYDDYSFVILPGARPSMPVAKSPYTEITSNPSLISNFDTTTKDRVGKSGVKVDLDCSNIKAGDAIWLQRSYDAYRLEPRVGKPIFSNGFLGNKASREWFVITGVDTGTKTISMEPDFDSTYISTRYPDSDGDLLPAIDSDAYSTEIVTFEFDNGVTKQRTDTIITISDGRFSSGITLPGTADPIGDNGLTTRWLAILKDTNKFAFYPIYSSSEKELRVVGDIVSDFDGIEDELTYFIAGDHFIVATGVFTEEVSDALIYVGATDAVSGVSDYCIKQVDHDIISTVDQNGNGYEYIDRQIPTTSCMTWKPITTGFIPLNYEKPSGNKVSEIYVSVRDKAGNVTHGSYRSMPSQCFRSRSFTSGLGDNTSPEGRIWINRNQKHTTSTAVVVDSFPARDNYGLKYMRLGNTPQEYRSVNWSRWLSEPNGLFFYWNRWTLGNTYTFKMSVPETTENSEFFKVKIDLTASSPYSNLNNIFYDFIGGIAKFIDDPTLPTHQIVDVWKSGSDYDTLVLKGTPGSYIKTGAAITITTTESGPSGTFSDGGVYATYYRDLGAQKLSEVSDLDKIATIKIDKDINFLDYQFASDLDLGDDFGVRWVGWFWADFDRNYEVILRGSSCSAKLMTENEAGVITLFDYKDIGTSTTTGEVTSGLRALNRGWNRLIIEFKSKNAEAKIAAYLRSTISDSAFQSSSAGITTWDKLPEIDSITNNTVTLTDSLFREGALEGGTALVGLLNGNTGAILGSSENAINTFVSYTIQNNKTQLNITGSDLVIDPTKTYFAQVIGDYAVYDVLSSDYDEDDSPFNYLLLKGDNGTAINAAGTTSYLIAGAKLQIMSNTEDTITFKPSITGSWSSVTKLGDNLLLTDESKAWDNDTLAGLPVVLDTDEDVTRYIISNTQNTIVVSHAAGVAANYRLKEFRIGDISDVAEEGSFLYAPVGRAKTILGESDLVRNAGKVYADLVDHFGRTVTFLDAISLKGSSNSGPNSLSGSIITYNLDTEKIDDVISIGGSVYDANETEEITGIYESKAISAPSGFLFWKGLTWDEVIPTDCSVEVYVRTAMTEGDLDNATYNVDAYGNSYPAYTSDDFDTPSVSPTAVDISRYSTDGTEDRTGVVKRRKWLQFKIVLKSTAKGVSPTVDNVRVTYSSSEERIVYTKNFELNSNIVRGFLSANVEVPDGTQITWGISTADSTDFNQYQIIPLDEAFEVLEPGHQFRLAAKLSSSSSAIPKIFNFGFTYSTEEQLELPNRDL